MSLTFEPFWRVAPPIAKTAQDGSGDDDLTLDRDRIISIDVLRGVVMVLMALDHTRDFLAPAGFNPRDVAEPALFLTSWITHFCAPIFIFLAGISAFLYGSKGRNIHEVSRFLFTRGLWLVLIEFTVVRLGWTFSFQFHFFVAQVIFAIGMSMIALAVFVYLPRWAIASIGMVMIAGHNMLDGIAAEQFGAAAPIWNILHEPGRLEVAPSITLGVLYPLIPWVGVMMAGYAFGPIFRLGYAVRMRWLLGIGTCATVGFIVLRASNLYGDPTPWIAHEGGIPTALSFINCEKYPPSLLYLAMTLGPALLSLAALESARSRLADWLTTFGNVPFFFYVAHLFLIHGLAVLFAWATIGDITSLLRSLSEGKPAGYGLELTGIYAVWLAVVVSLFPLCRWFAALKRRHNGWWWSYL